jgi:general secretion pathway protein H
VTRSDIGWQDETGMTLVEMLVVLAIIAVAAGAVALGVGTASRGPSAEAEARRLAARIQLAADEMMVRERPLAIEWDAKSYRLLAWQGGAWRGTGESHSLPIGLRLGPGAGPVPLGADQPVKLRMSGPSQSWLISYDGLNAAVQPVS